MRLFSKISERIYDRLEAGGHEGFFVKKEQAGRLYVNEDIRAIVREKGRTVIERIILILIATGVVCGLIVLRGVPVLDENNAVARSAVGEGDKTYDLEVSMAGREREKVSVVVTERELPSDRLPELFDKAEARLRQEILGDNPSLDNVSSSLDLVKAIEGTKIRVSWEADEEGFFSETGRLRIAVLKPEDVTVYATLHYFGNTRRIPITLTIVPPPQILETDSEKRIGILQDAIREADGSDPTSERMTLPSQAGGEEVNWREPADTAPLAVGLLGLLLAVMVVPQARSSLKDQEKKRREQMERDYPEIISKLILLLTAGETCSGAWKRICRDYLAAKPHMGRRFAYEEMLFSMRELDLGRSEAAVYESFGNRAGILCYKRLSALLSRNLRRGSREILTMLELESREAYAARFEAVRKKGEETSTKLLVPMMGMLVIVIAIIIVPAFMGMGI